MLIILPHVYRGKETFIINALTETHCYFLLTDRHLEAGNEQNQQPALICFKVLSKPLYV